VTDWRVGTRCRHFVDFTPSGANTFVAVFSGQMNLNVSNGEERQLSAAT